MKVLVFFLVSLALGSANAIGPTTIFGPSREDRIETAIDRNVRWLLSGIRNGSFDGPDLPRAVVAIFLAEPGFFSPGHEIGQELKNITTQSLLSLLNSTVEPPVEDLALYLHGITVFCQNPYDFFGYQPADQLYNMGRGLQRTHGHFPAFSFLALCYAEYITFINTDWHIPIVISDEEAVTMFSIECNKLRPVYIFAGLWQRIYKSEFQYYPSNMTVEKLEEMMNQGNSTSLSAIAAAMQSLMYIRQLRTSDLPSAVDLLLKSQDEDGSWGQSTLNSFNVLPVLKNKNFLNINREHCPPPKKKKKGKKDKRKKKKKGKKDKSNAQAADIVADGKKPISKGTLYVFDDDPILSRNYSNSLYDLLAREVDRIPNFMSFSPVYENGTDGKPYLTSLYGKKNSPEEGFFWNTYELPEYPSWNMTRLTQSHADIKVRRGHKFLFWFSHTSKQERFLSSQNGRDP